MKFRAVLTLGVVLLFTALCVAEDEGAPAPAVPAVEMEASFRIPQKAGTAISHTPAVVFTKDGKRMLTATSEGRIVVFDVANRRLLGNLEFPGSRTDGVSIDPSGRYAVWSLAKGGLAVMKISSGKIIARDDKLASKWVAISPDAKRVAVTRGKTVEIRELATLKLLGKPLTGSAEVTNVTWSQDGGLLGWTTQDGRVTVREPAKERNVYDVKKPAAMHAISFDPKGTRIAYGGQNNTIYQYTFATEKEDVIAQGQPFWITCVGYSPDGKRIAAGDESCDIWLFDVASKKNTFHNKHHVECWLNSVAWAPDNETFVFGCRPNSLAGRPSLHTPLTMAEAARSTVSRRSREKVLAALDEVIGKAKDDRQKKALTNYRAALAREESVQAYSGSLGNYEIDAGAIITITGGGTINGDFDGDGSETAMQTFGTSATRAPPKDLPESVRKLVEAHGKTVLDEAKKLRTDFCVNQWKVR